MSKQSDDTYCGFIAIVGRPNVGKSTLLNNLIAQKISITANKPQTTRHRIIGVKTIDNRQAVYIDTPGIHSKAKKVINKKMNRSAKSSLTEVEMVIFVVEAMRWQHEDQKVLDLLIDMQLTCPIFLIINKIDRVKDKQELLPFIADISSRFNFTQVMPISLMSTSPKNKPIDLVQGEIFKLLPPNPFFFPEDQVTDKSESFRISEIIREKLTRILTEELPYAITVSIEKITKDAKGRMDIHAIIWVERDSQKAIVIGNQGERLKEIGSKARLEMNRIFDTRIHLQLWVKVKANWSDNEAILKNLGSCDI